MRAAPGRLARAVWSRPFLAATLLLACAWVATLTLFPWSDESVGDLGVRRSFAALLLGGELPYRDFAFEYPPLAAPLIGAPGLVGTTPDAYWAGFAILTFGLALAVVALTGRLAAATGADPRPAMLAAAAFPLLAGAIVRIHFDLAPVALTLAALVAVLARRPSLGLALLGAGAMTKLFPLAAVPVVFGWLVARGEGRAALRGLAALCATVVALAGAAVALSPDGAVSAARYQLERPVQVESAPASALLAADALGWGEASRVASHKSTGIAHPLSGEVSAAFTAALAGCLVLLTLLAARRGPDDGDPADRRRLVLAALTAMVAFAALGRVLSPQYAIWLMPVLGLAVAWRMWALAAALAAGAVLTLAEFPSRYLDLVAGDPAAVAVTGARNAALLVAVALALGALSSRRPAPGPAAARSTAPARRLRPRSARRSARGRPRRSRT